MADLLVMVTIGGRRCAFPAGDVRSVIELGSVTPVPGTPDYLAGITALRSQALTVIDTRYALGIEAEQYPTDTRAAVVKSGGHSYALMVDEVEDITTAIAETGEIVGGFGDEWSRVSKGVVETAIGPALLVDLGALLSPPGHTEVAA